jgi:guanylate kinase
MSSEAGATETRRGKLFIIASPSGGGKTSLVNALLADDTQLALSVSHTTRKPRSKESSGKQYHFISMENFRKLVEEDAFLEHAMVFGNFYGTHAGALDQQLDIGLDVMLEIDWQGAAQVRKIFPDCCSIFILPPSYEILRQRLSRRAEDSEEIIERRMREAQSEISHWSEFDHLVVNEDFESALEELKTIVSCSRRGRDYEQNEHALLLAQLLGNG